MTIITEYNKYGLVQDTFQTQNTHFNVITHESVGCMVEARDDNNIAFSTPYKGKLVLKYEKPFDASNSCENCGRPSEHLTLINDTQLSICDDCCEEIYNELKKENKI